MIKSNAYILFLPDELKEFIGFFKFIIVTNQPNNTEYVLENFSQFNFLKHTSGFSKSNLELLSQFTDENLYSRISRNKELFKKQNAGKDFNNFHAKSSTRFLHEQFIELFKQENDVTFYHKRKLKSTLNVRTAPCKFKAQVQKLTFSIVKEHNLFEIITNVFIDNEEYNLKSFDKYKFLLVNNDDYFILSQRDHQVLDWLENINKQYYENEIDFVEKILIILEQTHAVEKNDIFKTEVIDIEPINTLFLSEISGSFLMLTPIWNYDGFKIEGKFEAIHKTHKNGIFYNILRHQTIESTFVDYIKQQHPNFIKQINGYFFLSFDDAKKKQWFLKLYHKLLEKEVEIIGMDLLSNFRYAPYPLEATMTVTKTEGNLIFFKLMLNVGNENVSLLEMQKILNADQRTIFLKDNSIAVFTDEFVEKYSLFIKHGRISNDEICIPQWLLVLGGNEQNQFPILNKLIKSDWWRDWKKWQETEGTIYPIPESIVGQLRNYQHRGFEWMVLLSKIGAGACLADDMGLGKTLQTISYLCHLKEENANFKSLVVTPASLVYNWSQEFNKFAPSIKIANINESKKKLEVLVDNEVDVIVCSYGLLRTNIELLQRIPWLCIVVDESHNIKNAHSLISKVISQLNGQHKVALSGTPIMNNTFDLFAQFNFILPGLLGNAAFFKKEYADPIDREKNKEKAQLLSKITAPFLLRRTKQLVAKDLPEKTETILWCEMGEAQMETYNLVRTQIKSSIFLNIKQEGLNKSKMNVLAGMQKLRQLCNSSALLNDPALLNADSIKLEVLIDEIKNNLVSDKVLIFSQFKGMLNLISERCKTENLPFYRFDGDTDLAERRDLIAQFQEEGNAVNLFLISLKAGNAGINLTAANYVFLVDPWWNSAVEQQAIDRTHRIGQLKNVFAYKMICKDTIEEKIIAIQQKKKNVSEAIISVEEGFVKNLTEEDIAFLFS